jgi:cytosine/adenosine deaminase-related metal-dependent hydrolase
MDLVLRALAVLTGTGRMIAPGAVGVRQGRISSVGSWDEVGDDAGRVETYQNAILIPGLVNAHAHLDLSGLSGPIPCDGDFVEWLMQVGKSRFQEPGRQSGIVEALGSLARSGVTALGDIAATGQSLKPLEESGLRGVVYLETLGHTTSSVDNERRRLDTLLRDLDLPPSWKLGFSPHAAYTAGPGLLNLLKREFLSPETPLSVHTGEILEEAAMLESGIGSIHAFLKRIAFLPDDWTPPGTSPVEYLAEHGVLKHRTSLVHMNFFTDSDLDVVAESQSPYPVTVVHCPKSHRYFRRLHFPARSFLDRRIPLALGTDSLASNDCLDMLQEMKVFFAGQPDVTAEEVLGIAALGGATALGLEDETGTLEPGKHADIAVIEVPKAEGGDWHERLLAPESRCLDTYVGGMRTGNSIEGSEDD